LPIKLIEREAYHRRKERHGTHHFEHEKNDAGEVVGQELVERALQEREEKERSRSLEKLAAEVPSIVEEPNRDRLGEKIPDRDLEFERKIIELSQDFNK
jgi:folate-dependent phosphoribosylglycinamide formyltransferase PurN